MSETEPSEILASVATELKRGFSFVRRAKEPSVGKELARRSKKSKRK